jgi:hypothetical protein
VHTDVTRYLEFKQIAGSFVYRDGKISKVPSTEMEAVRSPLMGLFEKRRAKKFFEFLQNWRDEDPATHQGSFFLRLFLSNSVRLIVNYCDPDIDLDKDTMKKVYETFGLEPGTQDFIGHAMALYLDDECVQLLHKPRTIANSCFQLHRQARTPGLSTHRALHFFHGALRKVTIHIPSLWPRRATSGICAPLRHLRWYLHARQTD